MALFPRYQGVPDIFRLVIIIIIKKKIIIIINIIIIICPQNCAFSDIFGPALTPRVVPLCMGIAICHRRKFGQVWESPAPLPEVAGNLRSRKAPLWTFAYHMEKSKSFCNVTPGL